MSRRFKLFDVVCCAAILISVLGWSSWAMADDQCSEILSLGIFDISKTSSVHQLAADYLKWLSNQEFSTQEQASSASASLGLTLPIEGIPVPFSFGGGGSTSSSSSWGKQLAQYLSSHKQSFDQFDSEFQKADANIVQAWSDCVNKNTGLICWAQQSNNPKEILFKLQFQPAYMPAAGVKPLVIRHVWYSGNLKLGAKEDPIGRKVSLKPIAFLYERLAGC